MEKEKNGKMKKGQRAKRAKGGSDEKLISM